ncbi:MAG: zf-HC2 domain-containing protein [Planctomycetes bacterium]|nr:zf-HC2 domain-containing protein [Planctomycetota bacterium]
MSACDAVRELLCAHALGALEDAQDSLVREHLGECEACRAAEGEARADVALLEAPPVAPSPRAFARIRARIAAAQAGDEPVRGAELDAQALISLSCSFCRGALVRADAVYCASCLAPHHPECWREYGRCSVMGCGEPRVVRPTGRPEVAPAPAVVAGGDKALDPDRRRRRTRWVGGGLGLLLGGGLAAAALAPPARLAAPAASLVTPAPAPEPVEPRWDVAVRDASLGELCAALEREAGARIDLSAGLTDVLLREGRWRGRTWREVVVEVARAHGLVVREEPDRVGLTGRPVVVELARSTLERRATLLLEVTPRWRLTELRSGPPHEVAVARAGRAIALFEGRSVRVLAPGRDATFTFQGKVERAAWSDRGERLAVVEGDRLAVIDLEPAPAVRQEGRLDEPVTALAWGPDPRLGVTASLASGRAWSRKPEAVDQRLVVGGAWTTVERPLVEGRWTVPLGNGALLTGERVGAETRLVRIDDPEGVVAPEPVDGRPVLRPSSPRWSRDVAGDVVELDLLRARALVVSPDGAGVLALATGEDAGELVRRRGPVFLAKLAPDGARLALVDDGALFVRRLDGEAADATVLLPGTPGPIVGCAWRGDGRVLALWSWQGALGVVDVDALDRGGAVDASLQLEEPALRRATWAGDTLVLTTATQDLARRPLVRVSPPGTGLDLHLEVDWTPADGEAARGDLFAPPAVEPAPAGAEPPAPPAHEAEVPPQAAPAPPAPAPLPPALAHVRPGQRYVFRGNAGDLRAWDVVEVTPEAVVYVETVTLRGARMGEPRRDAWRLQRPARTEAGPARREARAIGGVTFECLVVEVAGTTRWIAVQGEWAAFPGEVRYVRDGAVMLELVDVR